MPTTQGLTDEEMAALEAKHAAATGGLTDEQLAALAPPEPPDPTDAPERFVHGFTRTAVPSLDTITALVKAAVEPPLKGGPGGLELSGAPKFWKDYVTGAATGSLSELQKAWQSPSAMGKLGHVLGAVPIAGPPLAAEAERAAGGDVAGGLGGAAGIILPALLGARTPEGLSATEKAVAAGLEKSAKGDVVQMVGAPKGYVGDVLGNARKISETVPLGGLEKMLAALKGEGGLESTTTAPGSALGQALERLNKVKAKVGEETFDVMDAAQKLRESVARGEPAPPGAPVPAPETTAGGQPLIDAINAEADRLEQLAEAYGTKVKGTRTEPRPGGGTRSVPTEFTIPGEVPGSELFTRKQQANLAAKSGGAHQQKPLVPPSASAQASKNLAGVLKDVLEANHPELAAANADYSSLRQAADLITNALQSEAKSGRGVGRAVAEVGTRGALGAAGGLMIGGTPGAAVGLTGVGGIIIARELMKSPWFRNLSSKAKFAVADQLRTGTFTGLMAKGGPALADVSRQRSFNPPEEEQP